MSLYYFRLVDHRLVSDYGSHDLPDDTVAQIEALKLVESLRETRPYLLGQNYFVSVTNETGAGDCVIPLDMVCSVTLG
jgi:Domain of unknown function (DUF6894)